MPKYMINRLVPNGTVNPNGTTVPLFRMSEIVADENCPENTSGRTGIRRRRFSTITTTRLSTMQMTITVSLLYNYSWK